MKCTFIKKKQEKLGFFWFWCYFLDAKILVFQVFIAWVGLNSSNISSRINLGIKGIFFFYFFNIWKKWNFDQNYQYFMCNFSWKQVNLKWQFLPMPGFAWIFVLICYIGYMYQCFKLCHNSVRRCALCEMYFYSEKNMKNSDFSDFDVISLKQKYWYFRFLLLE